MLHEVAADQIMLIAETAWPCGRRRQEQARILQATTGEHHAARPDVGRLTLQRPQLDAIDDALLPGSLNARQVGVQQDRDVLSRAKRLQIALAEVGRRALLPKGLLEPGGRHVVDLADGLDPLREIVAIRSGLHQLLGPDIERLQLLAADRPAGKAEPRAWAQVDRVERLAPAGPHVGRAAEVARPRRLQRLIGQAHDQPFVERLRVGVRVQVAAFHQQHLMVRMEEFERQGNAGGAGADDHEIRLELLAIFERVQIGQHDRV